MPGRRWRLFALDSAPRYGRSGTFKALFRALRGSPPRRAQQVLSNSPACAQSSESSHSRAPPKRPSLGLRIPARSTTLTRRSAAEVRARRRARSYQPSARPRVTEPRLNRCAQVRGHFRFHRVLGRKCANLCINARPSGRCCRRCASTCTALLQAEPAHPRRSTLAMSPRSRSRPRPSDPN